MYKELKYSLDFMFLFMLVVSIILFIISFKVDIEGTALSTLHKIDFIILGGYYAFFAHGFYKTKQKITYVKQHWIMLALLLLPFLPIARLVKLAELERTFAISTNTLWHFLDELGLL
jgi:hypothetical protein